MSETAGVKEALAVSSDGLLLAASEGQYRENVEQLAAVVSGLTSLTGGASNMLGWNEVHQLVIEMRGGFLFVTNISDGSSFAVLAGSDCDLSLIAYEMTLLVDRLGRLLSPTLISELKNTLTV